MYSIDRPMVSSVVCLCVSVLLRIASPAQTRPNRYRDAVLGETRLSPRNVVLDDCAH